MEVVGIPGGGCMKATEHLRVHLPKDVELKPTEEFYSEERLNTQSESIKEVE